MKIKFTFWCGLAVASLVTTLSSQAQVTLFGDAFESGNLSQWTGKSGGEHHGVIVADPLNPTNHVLSFTAVNGNGDIFSAVPASVDLQHQQVVLSFDFLALPLGPVPPAEFGGFAGVASDNLGPESIFLAGDYAPALSVPPPIGTLLANDGQWHHYDINFTPVAIADNLTNIFVHFEDWFNFGSVPGDVFFDNVKLSAKLDPAVIAGLVPCAGPVTGGHWKNHGDYVSMLDKVTSDLVTLNLITPAEQKAYVLAGSQTKCGK